MLPKLIFVAVLSGCLPHRPVMPVDYGDIAWRITRSDGFYVIVSADPPHAPTLKHAIEEFGCGRDGLTCFVEVIRVQ